MPKGKRTCKILKEIRKKIAEENDIELVIAECTYQGDCAGTCPRCEAELSYLEQELERRQRLGKAVMISGLAVSTMLGATSCDGIGSDRLVGDVPAPSGIPREPIEQPLEGDVPMAVDTNSAIKEDDTLILLGEPEESQPSPDIE